MVAPADVRFVARPLSVSATFGIALAVALLAWRAVESPADPVTTFRALVGAIAIAAVVLSRRRSFAQKAALFFAIEFIGGVIAFAVVDLPLLNAHRTQIASLAVSLYQDVHQAH